MNEQKVVIEAHDLTKRFGTFTAVDRVSFRMYAGEVVGYLGPNGSGKTTTIRMLLGLLLPSGGSATVLGFDTVQQSEQIRARVGYMSQKFALYHDMTAGENLSFYAGVYGVRDPGRIQNVLELTGLQDHQRERVSNLSTGWRQRLALAAAIVHEPQLLFLDEPTSGVDPGARRSFWDLIYRLVEEGVTALVTTHYMDEAEYCGRVGIMRSGKLLAFGTPNELKTETLRGSAWDIYTGDPVRAVAVLQRSPLLFRVGLAGSHLRAIVRAEVGENAIAAALRDEGIEDFRLEPGEGTLEDVFLALS